MNLFFCNDDINLFTKKKKLKKHVNTINTSLVCYLLYYNHSLTLLTITILYRFLSIIKQFQQIGSFQNFLFLHFFLFLYLFCSIENFLCCEKQFKTKKHREKKMQQFQILCRYFNIVEQQRKSEKKHFFFFKLNWKLNLLEWEFCTWKTWTCRLWIHSKKINK